MSDLPLRANVVFVGAGHNALVAAAYLLQAGRSVCLLDQMPRPGGFVRTEELGTPGFHHDRWSAVHPMFVGGPAYAELGPDLARHGLEYVNAPVATGASLPNGKAAIVPVAQEEWAAELDRLGESGGWADLFEAVGWLTCSATAGRARCRSVGCSRAMPSISLAPTSAPRSYVRSPYHGRFMSRSAPRTRRARSGPSSCSPRWQAATPPRPAAAGGSPRRLPAS
jgi:phytoene dehydrogenase-like protein